MKALKDVVSRGSQHLSLDPFARLISDPLGHEDQEQQRLKGPCLASRPLLMSRLERDQAARRQRLVPRPTAGPSCSVRRLGASTAQPCTGQFGAQCKCYIDCSGQFRGAVEVLHGHALVSLEVQGKYCMVMHWSAWRYSEVPHGQLRGAIKKTYL